MAVDGYNKSIIPDKALFFDDLALMLYCLHYRNVEKLLMSSKIDPENPVATEHQRENSFSAAHFQCCLKKYVSATSRFEARDVKHNNNHKTDGNKREANVEEWNDLVLFLKVANCEQREKC